MNSKISIFYDDLFSGHFHANQVLDQPGINLTFDYTTRLLGNSRVWDILVDGTVSIGTVHTFVNPGLLFRLGKLSPYRRSLAASSLILNKSSTEEFHFFCGDGFRHVAYDATLMCGSGASVEFLTLNDINQLRFTGEFGVNCSLNRWSVSLSYFCSSGEFNSADDHRYGRLEFLNRI